MYNNEKCQRSDVWKTGRSYQDAGVKFLCGLISYVQKRFPYSYVLTALVALIPVNMPAKSFIFHGEHEIELHASTTCINFDVDLADVGSEWFSDTMFEGLIKLNKYSNEVAGKGNKYWDFQLFYYYGF